MHIATRSGGRRPSRALLVASLTAAAIGGGLFLAPSALAVTQTTAITGTPPHATWAVFYSFTFGTQGFTAPVHFSVDSGTLPAGLQLYQSGQLAGSPASPDPGSPVVVRASDGGVDPDATLTVSVPVDNQPLTWSSTPPETTTVQAGDAFYYRYVANHNPVTPTVSVSGGLPPGLTMNAAGELIGTPTAPGTYSFTVVLSNGTLPDLTVDSTIVVTGSGPSLTGDAPDTVEGDAYDFTYTLGGTPTPGVKLLSGQLPHGIDLTPTGHLTGWPDRQGTYTFTVAADNIVGPEATQEDTIVVDQAPLSITGTPPTGALGEPYDFWFGTEATGGLWTNVVSGKLPRGTQLLYDGELVGTPTRSGTFSFTIAVHDDYGNIATEDVTLVIVPRPTLAIAGTSAWEGNSGTTPFPFTITLSRASTVPVTVHWSTVDGTATAGSDYEASSGDVTFDPGQTTATVSVPVIGESTSEGVERFAVKLSQPVNATLGTPKAWGRILDDDRAGLTY